MSLDITMVFGTLMGPLRPHACAPSSAATCRLAGDTTPSLAGMPVLVLISAVVSDIGHHLRHGWREMMDNVVQGSSGVSQNDMDLNHVLWRERLAAIVVHGMQS